MQKGVVRTNCVDCLDRTNVTQVRVFLGNCPFGILGSGHFVQKLIFLAKHPKASFLVVLTRLFNVKCRACLRGRLWKSNYKGLAYLRKTIQFNNLRTSKRNLSFVSPDTSCKVGFMGFNFLI